MEGQEISQWQGGMHYISSPWHINGLLADHSIVFAHCWIFF